ncbi:Abhydrolase_3 domain-containing protein [Pseudozyma hubeiensis]|nr:Abhydrolase_3 domain-containing protein [Pseudozyma hubeiensis]
MNGGANGNEPDKNFVDQAADATSLHTSTDADTLSRAPSPKPYDPISERIPINLLRGQVEGSQFGVQPVPVAAFWQWKSMAAAVAHGQVISVKPGSDVAGIGSGPALSSDERMVLFFVGGGYHSGHAPQGPLSWSVCRQTSLRVLGVNFRKATSDKRAFPAALQDALAAWVYVTKRLHFKPENVILMGDSAGGGLALSLQLYLSSLMWSSETSLGRAKKLVLHSPMTDLTLSTDSFTQNNAVDIISPYMCSLARDNYLRHVMPVAGRKNVLVDEKITGGANVGKVAARYNIDPYGLTVEQRRSEKVRSELARLAKELPETILELGAFHPLFSLGLDARKNKYLAQCLLLLDAPPAADGENTVEMLVTAGTAEIFYDQIKLFVRNFHDLHPQDAKSGVNVSLVECIDWHHVFAYMNLPGKVKAQVDDVAKMFMLA